MRRIRSLILSVLLLSVSVVWCFADAAIPETMPSRSLFSKVFPIALGAVTGILVGRYLAHKRRDRH